MPHNVTFHKDIHCLLRQTLSSEKKKHVCKFYLEIVTCYPLNFTMDISKFIASIQKEECFSALRVLLITIFIIKV